MDYDKIMIHLFCDFYYHTYIWVKNSYMYWLRDSRWNEFDFKSLLFFTCVGMLKDLEMVKSQSIQHDVDINDPSAANSELTFV